MDFFSRNDGAYHNRNGKCILASAFSFINYINIKYILRRIIKKIPSRIGKWSL